LSCKEWLANCSIVATIHSFIHLFIHSFIQAISIAPLQIHYYSEVLLTQHGYRVGVSRWSATGNCEWRTCWRLLRGGHSGILTQEPFGRKATNLPMSHHAPHRKEKPRVIMWNGRYVLRVSEWGWKRLGSDYAQECKDIKSMCWSIKNANSTLGMIRTIVTRDKDTEEDLRRMFRWSQDWQMLLNLEKCPVYNIKVVQITG